MVKSKLQPDNITYKEDKQIDDEDEGYAATLYEYTIYDMPLVIALGKEKYTYSSNYNVVYYPIYLIINQELHSKIGVFEVDSNQVINIIDADGDIDLNKGNIIIYVSKAYLQSINKPPVDNSEIEDIEKQKIKADENANTNVVDLTGDDENEEQDVMRLKNPTENVSASIKTASIQLKNGYFTHNIKTILPDKLPEENETSSIQANTEYKDSSAKYWIQKFAKNNQYGIIDNNGAGDCFFYVIRDAFQQIGQDTTVDILRSILAKEVTEDLFKEMRTVYLNFLAEFQERDKELKTIKKASDILKARVNKTENKIERKQIIDEAKTFVARYTKVKVEKDYAKELLDEYSYMKDIDSIEKLRTFIMTRNYWADTWAISTLERVLNIKLIILSEEAYADDDVDSVMQCGQLNDTVLETAGKFTPTHYIITSYTGRHYKLITYKEKNIFEFTEIPYDIKALVINKCIEKNAGPYYLIKDFYDLKNKLGYVDGDDEKEDEYLNKDLYDKAIVFMFKASSGAKPNAGMGPGEQIPNDAKLEFSALNKISNWRKMLDDSWAAPFTVESKRWNTVEHYYIGSQFKKGFPDFYQQFSLDSGSDISKDLELARAAGSKSGKLKERILRESKIKIDPDFFEVGINPRSQQERKTALTAKFTQNLDLKDVLIKTKMAKLVHFIRRDKFETDEMLMKLRKDFSI